MADQSELALYETMFQKRFTEEDPNFMAYLQKPPPSPPIVDNWASRSRRNFQDRSQMGGRNEGWREGGRNEGWRGGGSRSGGDRREGYYGYGRNSGGYDRYQGRDRPYH